ncbi:PREDICTED: subtilisin-like protease SBT4.1 isoform X1 [Camelina sativa]|uniref:Subtilisin-like protease SBT4.1 isoform X1 n=1 Tax=Camelina sativa TaxID=90675 RepID=A0ABM0Z141_CAMSA|nr:PREDICTED: subtilisin-like protease SBT4.1 isoform X1 [Camelina sativa]
MAIAFRTFLLQLLLFFFASSTKANDPRETYLVQMKVGGHRYGSSSGHQELLGEVLDDDSTIEDAFIYSYSKSFTGLAARLTQSECQKLRRRREVLEVSRSRDLKLQTTRSWDFMNLTLQAERNPENESDLVVAVIGTGIWPYSEVFSSDSPPPPGWENKCEDITCNNKIVGARSYYPSKEKYKWIEEKSVIDVTGHGTHVASIVAGRKVEKASYFGLAEGTMRGGVPNAKIAVYKTCWNVIRLDDTKGSVCREHDVVKAIDQAILDKVDIISFSQGLKYTLLQEDKISWAFLRALNNGILTSAAAGNTGNYYKVANGAPWVMTVAASLKDRFFETKLELEGEDKPIVVYDTINTFETQDSFYPLLREKAPAELIRKRELIADCRSKSHPISSNDENDEGKDVIFPFSKIKLLDKVIKERAKGAIVLGKKRYDFNETKKLQFPIASIFLDKDKKAELEKYYRKYPSKRSVKIHKTEEIPREEGWVPTVAKLSSKGPNCDKFLANILKPDIAAPGLDIIAGWPENVNLTSDVPSNDYRHLRFNIMSGTSMACPHATGLALYLKSFTNSWSPSAVKSALMTTSTEMMDEGNEFAYGSGHLNATKVLDPGLVYETHYQDYIDYMCKQGYNTEKLRSDAGSEKIDCSKTEIDPKADLNYPTMTARVPLDAPFEEIFRRTVTNVYDGESTYRGEINYRGDKDFDNIIVDPPQLQFSELGQTKTFTVTVTGTSKPNWEAGKAFMTRNTWLTWTEIDGSRKVRSPIVIYSVKEPEACSLIPKT